MFASSVKFSEQSSHINHRYHQFSPVCISFSSDGNFLISGSKDGSLIKCKLYFSNLKFFLLENVNFELNIKIFFKILSK